MIRVAILGAAVVVIVVCSGGAVAAGEPMADAGLDQTVTVETTVQLDGTGSSHPDGAIAAYEWTIRTPDGREIEPDCADCERSQFTPTTVGRYAVNLTVTGPAGARSTDTLFVYVEDGGPDVELSGDRTPDPNQAVTYTASAESPDAELEEIAWAVEDEIVTVRSLDGSTDESELSLAFPETETYRVQVVVRDSNGRTAYDQLYVQPQSGSPSVSSWDEVEPTGCEDSTYAARNAVECWDLDDNTPSRPDEVSIDSPTVDPEEILYQTDGYQVEWGAGRRASDSSFVNTQITELGIDGNANRPLDENYPGSIGAAVDEVSTFLFGQERQTASCDMTVGEVSTIGCHEQVMQLEKDGETTNVYSDSETGGYAEYGLTNAERAAGEDPTEFAEGQEVEVTVVIQQKKTGVVEKTIETLEPTSERVQEAMNGIGSDTSSGTRSDSISGDSHSSSDGTAVESERPSISGGRGLLSGTPEISDPPSTSSGSSTDNAVQSSVGSRVNMGLMK